MLIVFEESTFFPNVEAALKQPRPPTLNETTQLLPCVVLPCSQ